MPDNHPYLKLVSSQPKNRLWVHFFFNGNKEKSYKIINEDMVCPKLGSENFHRAFNLLDKNSFAVFQSFIRDVICYLDGCYDREKPSEASIRIVFSRARQLGPAERSFCFILTPHMVRCGGQRHDPADRFFFCRDKVNHLAAFLNQGYDGQRPASKLSITDIRPPSSWHGKPTVRLEYIPTFHDYGADMIQVLPEFFHTGDTPLLCYLNLHDPRHRENLHLILEGIQYKISLSKKDIDHNFRIKLTRYPEGVNLNSIPFTLRSEDPDVSIRLCITHFYNFLEMSHPKVICLANRGGLSF